MIFAGRGLTTTAQRGAGQELPTDRVFEPVTKWAIRIDRAELVPEVLHQAVAKARGGRPGPVYSSRPARLHALRCQTALDWDGTDPIREG